MEGGKIPKQSEEVGACQCVEKGGGSLIEGGFGKQGIDIQGGANFYREKGKGKGDFSP